MYVNDLFFDNNGLRVFWMVNAFDSLLYLICIWRSHGFDDGFVCKYSWYLDRYHIRELKNEHYLVIVLVLCFLCHIILSQNCKILIDKRQGRWLTPIFNYFTQSWELAESFHKSSLLSSFYKASRLLQFFNNPPCFLFYCSNTFASEV